MSLFRRAERSKAKLRLGLVAPAGAGKTHSALLIAGGLGKRIALIDSENASASKEVGKKDIPDFDTLTLSAPYHPSKYIDAMKVAEDAGYDVIITDSLTHAWAGTGGLLDKVNAVTQASSSKNSYMAWRDVTPLHTKLGDAIRQSKCHVIVTMRSKVEYIIETDEKGKQKPRKVGLAPIQREGMDYELDVVLDLDQNTHYATASKDRTSLFDGTPFIPTIGTGEMLREWLDSGKEVVPDCTNCAKKGLTTPAAQDVEGNKFCDECHEKYKAMKMTA